MTPDNPIRDEAQERKEATLATGVPSPEPFLENPLTRAAFEQRTDQTSPSAEGELADERFNSEPAPHGRLPKPADLVGMPAIRVLGVVVFFSLGWLSYNAWHARRPRAQVPILPQIAVATPSVTNSSLSAATPEASTVSSTAAPQPEQPRPIKQDGLANSDQSERLRRIFDKSMQAADALKK